MTLAEIGIYFARMKTLHVETNLHARTLSRTGWELISCYNNRYYKIFVMAYSHDDIVFYVPLFIRKYVIAPANGVFMLP